MTTRAVLDANVLYPAALRSLLIDLSVLGVYHAHWTDAIQDEWTRNLLAHRPELNPDALRRTRDLMDTALDTARIATAAPLPPDLQLPDEDDRHVLAAALACGAERIVTHNLRDFPAAVLGPLGVQAVDPDTFVHAFLANRRPDVMGAFRRQRRRYRHPPLSATDLLDALERQGLIRTVAALHEVLDDL